MASKKGILKFPGRKCLNDICKLPLLEATPPQGIVALWNAHHKNLIQYWGRAVSTAAYHALRPRLSASPFFVIPVFRDKGLFNVVTNFDSDLIGVCPLGEWQKKQSGVEAHMLIQFFTELAFSKGLVLVRCEIQDKVFVRQDCLFITQMLLKYYTLPHLYTEWVEGFNRRPNQFDYHRFLRQMKEEAHKDRLIIKDKKEPGYAGGGAAMGIGGGTLSKDEYGPVIDIPPDCVSRAILNSKP